jgi:hypothetical protein
MSHSIQGADRLTHLKIVVVALIGATAVAGIGIAARDRAPDPDVATAQVHGPIIKAGQPVVMSQGAPSSIR